MNHLREFSIYPCHMYLHGSILTLLAALRNGLHSRQSTATTSYQLSISLPAAVMIDTNPRSKSEGVMATFIGYPSHGPDYSHIPRTPRRQQNPPQPTTPWVLLLSAPYPDNPQNSPNFGPICESTEVLDDSFGR